MLFQLCCLYTIIKCEEVIMSLLFGKDDKGYYTDLDFTMPIMIKKYKIMEGNKNCSPDAYTPKSVTDVKDNELKTRLRVSLANINIKEKSKAYCIHVDYGIGQQLYSEAFVYSRKSGQFDYIRNVGPDPWYEDRTNVIIASVAGILGFLALIIAYKMCFKSKPEEL